MGPFFARLAEVLEAAGARVIKVNFNGGDRWFYRRSGAIDYRGRLQAWDDWLASLLTVKRIDAVVLFGQARPVHRVARAVARAQGVPVYVFEEGYLRPDYITLEREGVNGDSGLPREAAFYAARPDERLPEPVPTGQSFWRMAWIATMYCLAMTLGKPWYPHHVYHRPMNPLHQGWCWLRGGWRKWARAWQQRGVLEDLCSPQRSKRWFLLPLQVHNDSQIVHHSPFDDVREVIRQVMHSFAQHASAEHGLVIKHHPMDRAYVDYGRFIDQLARQLGLQGRVRYVHDLHLPTLLKHARGVVVVNSTVGLQALFHHAPVITLGDCFYAVPGLVHPGPLSAFWQAPGKVDAALFRRFRAYLIRHTQINASFYADAPALQLLRQAAAAAGAAGLVAEFQGSMPSQPWADEPPPQQAPLYAGGEAAPGSGAAMNDADFSSLAEPQEPLRQPRSAPGAQA